MRVAPRILAVLISIGAAMMLILTGCTKPTANNQQLSSKSSLTSQAAASRQSKQAYYYDSLAAADRKKITFAFKANEDSTGHQEVGVPYNVNMAVRNKTDKTIKFDQRDFLVYLDSHHKSNSARSGELVLKPGETTTVHNLFKGVGGQSFVAGGMFVYLNSQLPLAYTYQAFMGDGVTSANLKDQKVIDINNPQPQQDESSSAASDSDDDDSADADAADSGGTDTGGGTSWLPGLVVTESSQMSGFAFKSITDQAVTIDPEMFMLSVDYQPVNVPQEVLDAGPVTIEPGQVHVYPNLFEAHSGSKYIIAIGNGGNMVWTSH